MRERVALLGVSVTCYIRWELPPPWHVHQVEYSYNRFEIISILPTSLSYKLGDVQQKISRAITCTMYNTQYREYKILIILHDVLILLENFVLKGVTKWPIYIAR